MSASAVVGYALVADSDRDSLVAIGVALLGAVVAVITTMMSNASANRRQRMELRYQKKRSGVVGFLFVVIAILTGGLVVVATRANEKTEVASAGPAPPSTLATDTAASTSTTPVPSVAPTTIANVAAPACAAFTVQIAAIPKGSDAIAEFEAQAQLLAQSLPLLGELHSDAGDACHATEFTQYYFGPFADGDAALAACFEIGQVLHDDPTTFTKFQHGSALSYPYYRVVDGISVTNPDGSPFLCNPELESG